MILGVDPGLANVGWCLLNDSGDLRLCRHVETHRTAQTGDAAHRLANVMYGLSDALLAIAAEGTEATVVIEWPGGAGGFQRDGASPNARATIQTSTTAGAVYGAAYWLLRGHTERILTPAPITWRAALAKAWGILRTEGAIHQALLLKYPGMASLQKKARPHILDAAGLAEYGQLLKGTRP